MLVWYSVCFGIGIVGGFKLIRFFATLLLLMLLGYYDSCCCVVLGGMCLVEFGILIKFLSFKDALL